MESRPGPPVRRDRPLEIAGLAPARCYGASVIQEQPYQAAPSRPSYSGFFYAFARLGPSTRTSSCTAHHLAQSPPSAAKMDSIMNNQPIQVEVDPNEDTEW